MKPVGKSAIMHLNFALIKLINHQQHKCATQRKSNSNNAAGHI